jgi:hypothetical protein
MEDGNLDAVNDATCREWEMVKMARVVGRALTKNSAAERRALSLAWERRAAPWSMVITKAITPSARLGDGTHLGAAPSRVWAAAGVRSGLAGGVKTPCPIHVSKLPERKSKLTLYI